MLKRRFSSGQLYLVLYFDSLVGNGDQPLHIHADIHTLTLPYPYTYPTRS